MRFSAVLPGIPALVAHDSHRHAGSWASAAMLLSSLRRASSVSANQAGSRPMQMVALGTLLNSAWAHFVLAMNEANEGWVVVTVRLHFCWDRSRAHGGVICH